MKRVVLLSVGAALALSLSACDRSAMPGGGPAGAKEAAAASEEVKQAFAAFNAAIAAKDLAAIRSHYADDAVMVLPGQAPFVGADAIMTDYETFGADPAGKYEPGAQSTYVSSGGDLAYGQVNYTVTFTNPQTRAVETANRYNLSVYKKQSDGSWKIVYDINTDIPKAG